MVKELMFKTSEKKNVLKTILEKKYFRLSQHLGFHTYPHSTGDKSNRKRSKLKKLCYVEQFHHRS